VLALAAMPFYLLLGVTPLASKLAVYCTASGLVVLTYVLLDRNESRAAALVTASGFAFTPPALFFASAALGNLHWTQLLFDYGLVLFGLELLRREGSYRAWVLFGLLGGLAVFHSPGSIPFVGISVLGTVLLTRPGWRRIACLGGALLIGAAPFFYKVFVHRAFGLASGSGEQTVGRLRPRGLDLSSLSALVYPEGAEGLLFQQTMQEWPLQPGWLLAIAWTLVTWLGLGVLLVGLRQEGWLRQSQRRLLVGVVPLLFVGVYLAATAWIPGARLHQVEPEFMNVRENGFRNLPVLWAGLLVGAGIGWTRLATRLGGVRARFVLALAAVPAVCGVLGGFSVVETKGPVEDRSIGSYRAVCFDAFGVFAAASLKAAPWRGTEVCELLETAAARRECAIGSAWGVGMTHTGLPIRPTERQEQDIGSPTFQIPDRTKEACERLAGDLVGECYFGVGWTIGGQFWGRSEWPSTACDSLPEGTPRDACWTGLGFKVGDHLHSYPRAMSRVLSQVPQDRRGAAAEGAGVGLGRGFGDESWATSFCERMRSPESGACALGVQRSFAIRRAGLD